MRLFLRDLLLASRNVHRQRRRSLMSVSAVAFGIIALILAGGYIEWVFWAMREGIIQSQLGHIQIMRPGYLESGVADPFRYLIPDSAPERDLVEKVPHALAVAPRLSFSGLASRGESTISFIGEGVAPEKEALLSRYVVIRKGQDLSADDPNGIVLGEGLASNLGADVGDLIVLLANTPTGSINAVEVTVRGLFSSVTKAYDDSALRLPLPVAQQLLRVSGTHRWLVLLDDTANTVRSVDELRRRLVGTKLEVVPWNQLADFYNKTVDLFSKQVGVLKMIIATIIMLSISNTLMMSVMERTGEIGTSMALGYGRKTILRLFVIEGALLAAVGGAAGLLAGLILAHVISIIGIPMPPPPGMAHGFTGEVLVTRRLALDALGLAFGTTLLASVYPAWKASRLEIVDALRHSR